MKNNRLLIQINKPSSAVYSFYINPQNTPLWADPIVSERTSDWPIKVGTVYTNQNRQGIWSNYTVTALKPNKVYELTSEDGNYHVRYTHKTIDDKTSVLEYYEWVDMGILDEPYTIDNLNKLKTAIEKL